MARLRFVAVGLLALALAGNSTQTGRSAGQNGGGWDQPNRAPRNTKVTEASDPSCVIYPLATMGYDSDLGQWIAETIPLMVEPSSWQERGGSGAFRYYAPKNILIIKNSAAVQTKVDGFLKDLKTSLPRTPQTGIAANKKMPTAHVVPAGYNVPAPVHAGGTVPESSSYPVPAPAKPPKHLFHFLIRYEGEGIIDDNVVRFMKVQSQSAKKDKTEVDQAADSPPATSGNATPSAGTSANQPPATSSSPPFASGRPDGPKQKEDKNDGKKEK